MDSKSYDELHGANNWDGLLDPLDRHLRSLIIGYGDLCSTAERVFNSDQDSKYCGYSRHGKSSFFKGVMLPWAESKYEVASFIYATATSKISLLISPTWPAIDLGSDFDSNWMGYIAVSNDEYSKSIGRREICVVWRGTVKLLEWLDDVVGATPVPAVPLFSTGNSTGTTSKIGLPNTSTGPKVMNGWMLMYITSDPNSAFHKTSARTQLWGRIKELLVKYEGENVSITCTGHSLGACLATLSAVDLAANVATPGINVSAFVFQSPQVGDEAFKADMEKLPNLKVLRVNNIPDFVPLWPSKIVKPFNEKWSILPSNLLGYVDVGIELPIDSRKSPYLKDESWWVDKLKNPLVYHNLEGVLHTLGGWTGTNGDFDWSLERRDLALVNMSNDYLKEEFKIPASWWVGENKGMVLNDDGHWVHTALDNNDHDLPVY